jgi:hypothetical protein
LGRDLAPCLRRWIGLAAAPHDVRDDGDDGDQTDGEQ